MRHRIAGNRLSRNSSLRWATVRDLAKATLLKERICTTQAKAKEARRLVDKLISLGKNGTLAAKRSAFSILCDHRLVKGLFAETSPRFKNRVGGYTRIIPLGRRRGDNAELVYLELTEKREVILGDTKTAASAKLAPKGEENQTQVTDAATRTEAKEHAKEESLKPPEQEFAKTKREQINPAKIKPSGKFMGGIRKMFNRKVGGE